MCPSVFERSSGQASIEADFVSRGSGYSLLLEHGNTVFQFPDSRLHMVLAGGAKTAAGTGLELLPGRSNYFIGRDATKWRTDVAQFGRVRYGDVYPGIDLIYYGTQRKLEYDFVVHPGANPSKIELAFTGADALVLDASGNLIVRSAAGEMKHNKPVVYQDVDGERVLIEGSYRISATHKVKFDVGRYRRNLPLVIDPVLVYSSYIGGSETEANAQVAVDSAGNIYLAGTTRSADLPITPEAFRRNRSSSSSADVFVMKLNPSGDQIMYSTFLGSAYGEGPIHLGIDLAGSVYVIGKAVDWLRFPATANALATFESLFLL
jgi:hypothetical protein